MSDPVYKRALARIQELEDQDALHWRTRRSLLKELETTRAAFENFVHEVGEAGDDCLPYDHLMAARLRPLYAKAKKVLDDRRPKPKGA